MAALRKILSMGDNVPRRELNAAERDDLMRLRSLQELPKARYASKVALTALPKGRGRKVVYSHVDLYKMVENIANTLREQGVRPDTVCAVALPNSVEAIVYFLAIVWIGAIVAPIDVELELDDVIKILQETKAATLVSPLVDEDDAPDDVLYQRMKQAAEALDLVEWHITRTTNEGVVLETHGRRAAEGAAWSGGASDFQADSTQVALYMAKVPEEEEKPLVLPLTHQNFAAAIRMFSHTYSIDSTQVTVLIRPWSTVDALNSILATIYSGGHLVMPGGEPEPNEDFLKVCTDYKVDWFTAAPKFILSFASLKANNSAAMSKLKLKFIRSITGQLSFDEMNKIEDAVNVPILEAYGTPETCGVVACNVETDNLLGTKGLSVADCVVKIFDTETLEPLPVARTGLVGVAGANVTSGYLNNDEANSKMIVREENTDGSETIFILTGDDGRMDDDGFVYIKSPVIDSRTENFSKERALTAKIKRDEIAAEIAAEKAFEAEYARVIGSNPDTPDSMSDDGENEEEELLEKSRLEAIEEFKRVAEEERAALAREKEMELAKRKAEEERDALEREEAIERFQRQAAEERAALEAAEEKARQEKEEAERKEREAAEERAKIERQEAERKAAEEKAEREAEEEKSKNATRALVGGATAIGTAGLAATAVQNRSASISSSSAPSDSASPRVVQHTATDMLRTRSGTKVAYVQQPALEVSTFDPSTLDEISARLGVIESNQRRLETEVMAQHAEDLAALRKMLDNQKPVPKSTGKVEMDEVSNILNSATNAAVQNQRRSEEALLAARAAVDAAAAKQAAANSPRSPRGILHKAITIDLPQIETAIVRHVSVEQARAFCRLGDDHVYCAVKMKNGARASEQWLKLHAQSLLPATHVPKTFYEFDTMTKNTTREALAEMKDLKPLSATNTTAVAAAVSPSGRRKITISASSWIPSLRNVRSNRTTSMTP